MDAALENAGLEKRKSGEKLCLIIPKWHIETWLVSLSGFEVDEERKYKNDPGIKNVEYVRVANEFVERYRNWKQGDPTQLTPSSMITSFEEMKRINL